MRITFMLNILLLLSACDSDINPCNQENTISVEDKEGTIMYDDRFKQRVIRHHVPGTIDSFEVYIPCGLAAEFEENTPVIFNGFAAELPAKKRPDTSIGVESYFTFSIISIVEVSEE